MFSLYSNLYSEPTVSGVTRGTINVPCFVRDDWAILEEEPGRVLYCNVTEDGIPAATGGRLQVVCQPVKDIYKNTNVPKDLRFSDTSGTKIQVTWFDTWEARDTTITTGSNSRIAVIPNSIQIIVPNACGCDAEQLMDTLPIPLSYLSKIITSGTMQPLSAVERLAQGALVK